MPDDFERNLEKYAEVIVKVGLNLQPGQKLLINSSSLLDGAPLEAAPLIRLIAKSAYQIGARLVDVIWGDDEIMLTRHIYAPKDSFAEYPSWKPQAHLETVQNGDGYLAIIGSNPDLLQGQAAEQISTKQQTISKLYKQGRDYGEKHPCNWCVIALPVESWAAKVFPEAPHQNQLNILWNAIFQICRVNESDPIAAWETHIQESQERAEYMTNKRFHALQFRGPGTDLKVGIADGHQWIGAQSFTEKGFGYVANIPSEEIFTIPHRSITEGVVTVTKPLSRGGAMMDGFSMTFENGRVINVQAKKNEAVLKKLIETDEGAARLGEVALVPHSSPISQSGLLFYNTLYDENASCHIALGSAYRETMKNGEGMSDEEFADAGGNDSLIHVDFMIGSGEMNVDGIREDGSIEAVMRNGEWAIEG